MAIDRDKLLAWLTARLTALDHANDWDADEFCAGQYAAFRQIEDLVEDNFFEPISGVTND